MSKEISQFEAKAYKRLYEMYKSTLLKVIHNANTTIAYSSDKPEVVLKMLTVISDERSWDSNGIESKIDAKIIDELEKCLSNE
jgi:hypothetical protein